MKKSANAKRYARNHKAAGGDGWSDVYREEGVARKAARHAAELAEAEAKRAADEAQKLEMAELQKLEASN
jgi:multimeric flavodoxin WrbA